MIFTGDGIKIRILTYNEKALASIFSLQPHREFHMCFSIWNSNKKIVNTKQNCYLKMGLFKSKK